MNHDSETIARKTFAWVGLPDPDKMCPCARCRRWIPRATAQTRDPTLIDVLAPDAIIRATARLLSNWKPRQISLCGPCFQYLRRRQTILIILLVVVTALVLVWNLFKGVPPSSV